MLFDATLQVASLEVVPNEDHVQIAVLLALGLPTGDGVMPIPGGLLRFGLGKKAALIHGQELLDAGNSIEDPKPQSDLIVAQSLAGVEQVAQLAQQTEKLKGKQ